MYVEFTYIIMYLINYMQCMYVCLLDHICMICWKQTTAPERREVAQLSPELQNIDFTAALLYGY